MRHLDDQTLGELLVMQFGTGLDAFILAELLNNGQAVPVACAFRGFGQVLQREISRNRINHRDGNVFDVCD